MDGGLIDCFILKAINELKVNLLSILPESDPLFKNICAETWTKREAKTEMDGVNTGPLKEWKNTEMYE